MDPAQRPLGLHHIGIAVPSIAEALPHWIEGLGLVLHAVDDVPAEGVRVAVLMCGTTRIELVEPMGPETPVAKFLQKRGPGVHHLAFHVRDGQQKLDQLAAAGAPVLNKSPGPGAHGCKVAFVHPKYLNGVMAELVEDPHHE